MKLKYKNYSAAFLIVITLMAGSFWLPHYFEEIIFIAKSNIILGGLLIFLIRVIGMLVPPIPGGVVSLALIPVFGWLLSFLIAYTAMLLGAVIAFYIARYFREPLVKRFTALKDLAIWEKNIGEKQEFWTFLGIRLVTGSLVDFVSYAAGLSTMKFSTYFITTAVALLPQAIIYRFSEVLYQSVFGKASYFIALVLIFYITLGTFSKKPKPQP